VTALLAVLAVAASEIGEPVPDPDLPSGEIAVSVEDDGGKPLGGASLFVEVTDASGTTRRLDMRTDPEGRAVVEGLPAGASNRIVVGHESAGELLVATRPFRLEESGGVRLRLAIPSESDDPARVVVAHLHVVLERVGDLVRVTEVFSLRPDGGVVFRGRSGYLLPLPAGASAPRLAGDGTFGVAVREGGFAVTRSIPPQGIEVAVAFDVPAEDGVAAFEQRLLSRVEMLQVISTWTAGRAALTVDGLSEARKDQMENGIVALVAAGRDLDGALRVELSGLEAPSGAAGRAIALALCLLFLGGGLIARMARAIAGRRAAGPGKGGV